MKGYTFCPNCFQMGTYNGQICKGCGYVGEPTPKNVLLPGTQLKNRYFIGRVLGIGGFGVTYLAFDPMAGGMCAVKEYFPRAWAVRDNQSNCLLPNGEVQTEVYQHGRDVFINEAKILQGLYANPHVVNVYDFFYDKNGLYGDGIYSGRNGQQIYEKKEPYRYHSYGKPDAPGDWRGAGADPPEYAASPGYQPGQYHAHTRWTI